MSGGGSHRRGVDELVEQDLPEETHLLEVAKLVVQSVSCVRCEVAHAHTQPDEGVDGVGLVEVGEIRAELGVVLLAQGYVPEGRVKLANMLLMPCWSSIWKW